MTTTGEYLVSISTLTTGTALEHFLNISTGGGGGLVLVGDIDIEVDTGLEAALADDGLVAVVDDGLAIEVDSGEVEVEVGGDDITGEAC